MAELRQLVMRSPVFRVWALAMMRSYEDQGYRPTIAAIQFIDDIERTCDVRIDFGNGDYDWFMEVDW